MPSLTSTEQAKLEHSLALAHRHLFGCEMLYRARDAYDQVDELRRIADYLYELLEDELKRGGRLRTRVS